MNKIITFFGVKHVIIITLLALLASSVSILSYMYPFFFQNIIEHIEKRKEIHIPLILSYGTILLTGITLQYAGNLGFNKYILNLYYTFKSIIFTSFLNINDREKKNYGIGAYQTRINTELDGAFSIMNIQTFKCSIFLIRLLFALYIGFLWNIVIGFIFIINIIAYIIAAFLLKKKNGVIIKELSETYPKYNSFIIEFLNGISTIINRRLINVYLDKHSKLCNTLKSLSYKDTFNTSTITFTFVDIIHIVSTIIILAYSLQLYIHGIFTLGKVFAVLEYFRYIVDPIDLFNVIYNQYLRSSRFIERLYEIITNNRINAKIKCIDDKAYFKFIDLKSNQDTLVSFNNVTSKDNDSILLHNVSFTINRNEKVAIIGRSGEGKSIIIDILLKNIGYTEGCVEFMGIDIQKLDRLDIISNIGYYDQDIYIFNDTLSNNIIHSHIENVSDQLIQHCGLEHLQDRLLGENGINISKGEKSRIELLRLMLNNNKVLFLLDEPFDGLDYISKQEMILKTREYLKDKTSIIISHDFNIIKELATKYILINNNNINVGTHDELYNTVMIYKELYNSYSKSR